MRRVTTLTLAMAMVGSGLISAPDEGRAQVTPAETREIAEVAFIYGLPLVMNYAVFYEYFVDTSAPGYKAPLNTIYNAANVYTPADTTIVTPNSDTPYSFVGMDLRAEPLVICNPDIEKSRYFSIQLVDLYTFNFGYMGTRTTGNGAACGMVTGPGWTGETPEGVAEVFHSETEFGIAGFRTQLFDPGDIDTVRKIQAGYRVMPLSEFLDQAAPPAAPAVDWPKIDKALAAADPFAYVNFVLQFAPPTGAAEVEAPLRARFAEIGIEAGKPFAADKLTADQKAALEAGVKSGQEKIQEKIASLGSEENGWRVTLQGFGDRKAYGGDWLLRAAAAEAGIFGNSPSEAVYPLLAADSDGNKPDTATNRYTLTFPKGGLPPVNAFWSVTMYDGKTQLLIENPINRYLINTPMLPDMKTNADGSITLYLQKDSPGADLEANWLPAPDGPAYVVMRLYWPKEGDPSVYNATWKPPAVQRAQ